MKHYILLPVFALFLTTMACESFMAEEEETICFPVSMSMTLVQGSQTNKIIADFYYVPETDRLDHITWSNYQTHYFEYDESNRIKVVRIIKVKDKVQEEQWYVYDGSLVERIDLVKRNLDYTFLEPLDSIYTGYVEYSYEGKNVIEESVYEISAGGYREEYIRNVTYAYDNQDNLLSSTKLDVLSGESNTISMTYDQSKHPYSALQYYFEGESYVNNLLSRSVEEGDFDYVYELSLNEYEYPNTVYEKLGAAYTRFISYDYECK